MTEHSHSSQLTSLTLARTAEPAATVPSDLRRPLRWMRNGFVVGALGVHALALASIVPGSLGTWMASSGLDAIDTLKIGALFVLVASALHFAIARSTKGVARSIGESAALALGTGALSTAFAIGAAFVEVLQHGLQRGRQIRRDGKVLLARVSESGCDWTTREKCEALAIPEDARGAIAAAWRENGRTEHASVAAFARLSTELIALGAPPALLHAAHADAIDEVHHTELCFALARAIDGRALGPSAFPEARLQHDVSATRQDALLRLAVDSLFDGALHEGVSARIVAKLAKQSAHPDITSLLRTIARDEGATPRTRGTSSIGVWPKAARRSSKRSKERCRGSRMRCTSRCPRRRRTAHGSVMGCTASR